MGWGRGGWELERKRNEVLHFKKKKNWNGKNAIGLLDNEEMLEVDSTYNGKKQNNKTKDGMVLVCPLTIWISDLEKKTLTAR